MAANIHVRRVVAGRLSDLTTRPREIRLGEHATAVVLPLKRTVGAGPPVAAFINRCPHAGTPLNMFPDASFYDRTGKFLLCGTHGALFEPAGGLCVRGPCSGQSLTPVPVELERIGSADARIVLLFTPPRSLPQQRRPSPGKERAQPAQSLDAELDQLLGELDDGAAGSHNGLEAFYAPRDPPARRR